MAFYELDQDEIWFPVPGLAEENGLLAVGGDLSPERLILAYQHGIFPWYQPEEEILWWCPKQRFVIIPHEINVSKSMQKFMRKIAREGGYQISMNQDFVEVMHQCRMIREAEAGTWISDDMEEAYARLFRLGFASSVEVRKDGKLVGGLYGVVIGKCFFGESMFSLVPNGSKLALISLAVNLANKGFVFIDCQFHTDHLESMGGRYLSYEEYMDLVRAGLKQV